MSDDLDRRLEAFLQADVPAKRALLEADPALLETASIARLEEIAGAHPENAEVIRAHAALLGQCAAEGVGPVFEALAQAVARDGAAGSPNRSLPERVVAAVQAPNWTETRAALEADPELVSEAALAVLEQVRDAQDHEGARGAVEEHLTLFRRAGEIGIAEAFAEKVGAHAWAAQPEPLFGLLRRIAALQDDPMQAQACVALIDEALALVTRPAQDPLWASLQDSRANALQRLGELAGSPEILADAVAGYDRALEVRTREASPSQWAGTQQNRAAALQRLGDLAGGPEILADAVAGYDRALEVFTREASPSQWAMTQQNRAAALRSLGALAGSPEILADAVAGYDRALEVRTREASPSQWAGTQQNRAAALQRLGDLAGSPEILADAVAGYDRALEVFTQATHANYWAGTQQNRANALQRLGALAGSPEILADAVAGYDRALEVRTREAMPADWAMTQQNRANALQSLGDLAGSPEILADAVAGFERALEVFTREAMPADWAMTQQNRANALLSLGELAGSPEILADAVAGFERALEVRTREAMPADWATTQQNRANALQSLGELAGSPEILADAVAGYDRALEVATREASPSQWAGTQQNRAAALQRLGELAGSPEILADAVAGYDRALEVATREASPSQWATTQQNRAAALRSLGELAGSPEILADAVAGYDRALEVATREASPSQWATTQQNRAAARASLWDLTQDPADLEAALADRRAALEVLRLETAPDQALLVIGAQARLLFRAERLDEMAALLDPALAAAPEMLPGLARGAQEQIAARLSGLAELRAWAALALDEGAARALEIAERGRARLLALGLAPDPLEAVRTEERLSDAEIAEIEDLAARIATLRRELRDGGASLAEAAGGAVSDEDAKELVAKARAAREADLRAAIAAELAFRAARGLLREAPARRAAELAATVPAGGAAVLLLVTPAGARALILRGSLEAGAAEPAPEPAVLDLPGLDQDTLRAWLFGPKGAPKRGGVLRAFQDWDRAAAFYRRTQPEASYKRLLAADAALDAVLRSTLAALWRTALGPLDAWLRAAGLGEDAPVVLLPPGLMTLLPLGAAAPDLDRDPDATPFQDRWQTSLAPSFAALGAAEARLAAHRAEARPPRAVAVLNPTPDPEDKTPPPDLPAAGLEGDVLARHVPPGRLQRLPGAAATRAAVEAALETATLAHFATHAGHDWIHPERSGLQLAEGVRLTLEDLLGGTALPALRLAVMAACESGLSGIRRSAEEFVGLPAGWMQAGAMAVLGSHWPVGDKATLLLVARFYAEHLDAEGREIAPPARALARAARWLRGVTNAELAAHFEPLRHPDGRVVPLVVDLARPRAKPDPAGWAALAHVLSPGADGAAEARALQGRAAANRAAKGHNLGPETALGGTSESETENADAGPDDTEGDADAQDRTPWTAADIALVNATDTALLLPGDDTDDPAETRPFAKTTDWAAFSLTGI